MKTEERISRNRAMEVRIAAQSRIDAPRREAAFERKLRRVIREFMRTLPSDARDEVAQIIRRAEVRHGR